MVKRALVIQTWMTIQDDDVLNDLAHAEFWPCLDRVKRRFLRKLQEKWRFLRKLRLVYAVL